MENKLPSISNNIEEVKFTTEESTEINQIRLGFEQATIEFGKLYLEKLSLEKAEEALKNELALLEKQEKEFYDKIVTKYGEGTYDTGTNTFRPKK